MKTVKDIKDIPLQQRKQARTRLALLDAAIELMREKPLSEIPVEEICREVEVSRGTFFRYFPRKIDLLFYRIHLWSIESVWHADKMAKGATGLAFIEALFEWTARLVDDHPRLFSELIALRAFAPLEFVKHINGDQKKISLPERLLRFPDMEGIDTIPDGTFHHILETSLKDAIANNEITGNINIQDTVLSLASIFYGVPLMIADQRTEIDLSSAYKRQLKILWCGLKHMDWDDDVI